MKKIITLFLFTFCSLASAQDTVRVCTYNVLNISNNNIKNRIEHFTSIFSEIKPDILLLQEVTDSSALADLVVAAETPGKSMKSFNIKKSNLNDIALIYNANKFLAAKVIYFPTTLREVGEYSLINQYTGDSLFFYNFHSTEIKDSLDEFWRANEIGIVMQKKNENQKRKSITAGTFHFLTPEEFGYTVVLNGSNPKSLDPLQISGSSKVWERNSGVYSRTYTNSTRLSLQSECENGSIGGLQDRFDFIFYSVNLSTNYIAGSYTTFGNDGQIRLNSSLSEPPNIRVSPEIASRLQCASDHLPVYADFVFNGVTDVEVLEPAHEFIFSETQKEINLFFPSPGKAKIMDILGQTIKIIDSNGGNHYIEKISLSRGIYFIESKVNGDRSPKRYKFIVSETDF